MACVCHHHEVVQPGLRDQGRDPRCLTRDGDAEVFRSGLDWDPKSPMKVRKSLATLVPSNEESPSPMASQRRPRPHLSSSAFSVFWSLSITPLRELTQGLASPGNPEYYLAQSMYLCRNGYISNPTPRIDSRAKQKITDTSYHLLSFFDASILFVFYCRYPSIRRLSRGGEATKK